MKTRYLFKFVLLLFFLTQTNFAQEAIAPSKEALEKHVKALCATETAGRLPGTEGIKIAKNYIINEFKAAGLEPFSAGGFNSDFEVITKNRFLKDKSRISIYDTKEQKSIVSISEFQPIFSFENFECLEKEVVFVGYGISDPKNQYDDYAGVEVKDKIVLMLRYDPTESNEAKYNPSTHASWKTKFQTAKDKGALAIILFNGFNSKQNGVKDVVQAQRFNFFLKEDDSKIPFIHAKQKFIFELEEISKIDFLAIQKGIDQNKKANSFVVPSLKLSLNLKIEKTFVTTSNIVAYIPGSDPILKNETIVIGAHYDHVGLGTFGSRTYTNNSNKIHPGADDNASGTSAIIEIGKYLKNSKIKRSAILICFSAEEMGLFGSINFLKQNEKNIKAMKAMINLDMIGCYREDITVRLNGIDTNSLFRSFFKSIPKNQLEFTFTKYSPENGMSDHSSFFLKEIPCVHYFTGYHEKYHHPTDTPEIINYEGLSKITLHSALFAEKLLNFEGAISFNKDFTPKSAADPGINCTTSSGHVKIIKVEENYPAAKAGLKAGDIILEMDHVSMQSAMDYFSMLREYSVDSKMVLTISRIVDGVSITQEITIEL